MAIRIGAALGAVLRSGSITLFSPDDDGHVSLAMSGDANGLALGRDDKGPLIIVGDSEGRLQLISDAYVVAIAQKVAQLPIPKLLSQEARDRLARASFQELLHLPDEDTRRALHQLHQYIRSSAVGRVIDGEIAELAAADKLMAVGTARGQVHFVDLREGTRTAGLRPLQVPGSVEALAWDPEGRYLAVAARAFGVLVFEPARAPHAPGLTHLLPEGKTAAAAAFSPSMRRLAIVGADDRIRVGMADESGAIVECQDAIKDQRALAWSADETHLASGGGEGLKIWNVSQGCRLAGAARFAEPVTELAWRPDGREVTVLVGDRTGAEKSPRAIIGIDAAHPEQRRWESTGDQGAVTTFAWQPGGKAVLGYAPRLRHFLLWDPERTDMTRFAVQGGAMAAAGHQLSWRPGRTQAAIGFIDGSVALVDVASRSTRSLVAPQRSPVTVLAWRGDGARLAVGWTAGAVHLVDPDAAPETGNLRGDFSTPLAVVDALGWVPSSASLAVVGSAWLSRHAGIRIDLPLAESVRAELRAYLPQRP